MQLSLTHNGDFGFEATLTVDVGKENVDKFGNLYYYDSDGKLVFMNAGKISADGSVDLTFSHASDYVIVIGENQTPAKASDTTTRNIKKAVKTNDTADTGVMSMVLLLGVAVISASVVRKKRFM